MTADISTDLTGWSTTASSNQPDYSDSVGPNNLADNLRALQAGVRYLISYGTIASATTTDLNTVKEAAISVTGTTTITALGTVPAGVFKTLVFSGALTFTHNATSLILPTGASITTAAGDCATMLSLGSGNWRCVSYMKANGTALSSTPGFTDGTVSAPGIYFSSDTNNGFYRVGTDNWGATAGGTKVLDFTSTAVSIPTSVNLALASSSYLKIGSGTGSGQMSNASGTLKFNSQSNANPGFSWYFPLTAGTYGSLWEFDSGNTPTHILQITSADAADTGKNFIRCDNSGGAAFRVRHDGAVFADGAYSGSGADFAEWFECDDPAVFRSGDAVTLEHGKARLAGPYDDPIGVVSVMPAVIGNHELEGPRVLIGLVGQLWVNHGAPRGTRWKLMKYGDAADLYLVR